jgi:hypothetical protein
MENTQNTPAVKADLKTRFNQALVVGSAAVVCGSANAAIDVSGVTGAITEGATAAAVVGAAALVFVAGIKIFNKIRGAV